MNTHTNMMLEIKVITSKWIQKSSNKDPYVLGITMYNMQPTEIFFKKAPNPYKSDRPL